VSKRIGTITTKSQQQIQLMQSTQDACGIGDLDIHQVKFYPIFLIN